MIKSILFLSLALLSFRTHATCTATLGFKPILFSLEKDGVESHLVGIFHQTVDAKNLPKEIVGALDNSKYFINEVNQSEPFPQDLLFFPEGAKSSQIISPNALLRVSELFPGIPDNVRPVLPYMQYMEYLMLNAVGQNGPGELFDATLRNYALGKGKEIRFLDTQREVIQRFVQSVSPEILEWTLLHLNPRLVAESFQKQRNAFIRGDLEKHGTLYRQAHSEMKIESLFQSLIVERNQKWVSQIADAHKLGPSFFAVGVGHLSGPEGLPALLEKMGFTVSRVAN